MSWNVTIQNLPVGNSYRTSQLPPCQHVRQRRQRILGHAPHHSQTRKSARLQLSAWDPFRPTRQTDKSVGYATRNLASPWGVRLHEGNSQRGETYSSNVR